MNFVENNGKKVAAILCVASALPVVGTLYAMESQPGWHGDKYVKKDHKVAKGWTKVGSKSYYFDENGNVDKSVSKNASATVVSTDIADTAKTVVKESTSAAVNSEAVRLSNESESSTVAEEATTPVVSLTNATSEEVVKANDTEVKAETLTADTTEKTVVEATVAETVEAATPSQDTNVVVNEVVSTPVQQEQVQTQEQTQVQQEQVQTQEQTQVQQEQVQQQEQTQVQTQEQTQTTTNTSSSFQQSVADAALAQVGDHKWCTDVATDALNAAAGSEVYGVYWPSGYMQLGTVFQDRSQLVAGDLVYYQNDGNAGSAGVTVPDHIAVYVGDNTVVNGGWNYGPNVATSDIDTPAGTQYYIRVNG